MYIKIRKLGDKHTEDLPVNVSKKAKIQELREIIYKELGVSTEQQRLLYKGKQLVDDHCLMEYNVQLNDVIQLMVKTESDTISLKLNEFTSSSEVNDEEDAESIYFRVGDNVDMRDIHGAWFEGKIVKITKRLNINDMDLTYHVIRLSELQRAPWDVGLNDIRPRSHCVLGIEDICVSDTVLVNYNIDNPKTRGYWYDLKITKISGEKIMGTILFGIDKAPIDDCEILYLNEIYKIEPTCLLDETAKVDYSNVPLRKIPFNCLRCKDHPTRKCKECGCKVCFGKNNWEEILLCDECDDGYHIGCLTPPLTEIPKEDEWYCPQCKTDENEIVKAGDKLKFSKKRAKMPSAKEETNARDWGRGMACVGRTKECTIVSKDHIGPIPGIEVGTCWKFRFQVWFTSFCIFLRFYFLTLKDCVVIFLIFFHIFYLQMAN